MVLVGKFLRICAPYLLLRLNGYGAIMCEAGLADISLVPGPLFWPLLIFKVKCCCCPAMTLIYASDCYICGPDGLCVKKAVELVIVSMVSGLYMSSLLCL